MVKFSIREVPYFSENDERRFFEALESTPGVVKISGELNTLDIEVDQGKLDDCGLRELLALFMRYDVDMSGLRAFLNDQNRKWFHDNPSAYWHGKVFGTTEAVERS